MARTNQDSRIGRLRWRARRGMQELDQVLERFFNSNMMSVDENSLAVMERLLECQDTELLDWLLGRSKPRDPQIGRMVELILSARGS